MDALNEILQFLERHTGFAQDLDRLVESSQWPDGWLTSHQLAQEADRFQFWTGLRNRVPDRTRPLLLDHYLRNTAADDATGWVCIDDQFKLRPHHRESPDELADEDGEETQNRRHGRIQCELLTCQYGEVENLSASGVMIRGKGSAKHAQDNHIPLDLECLDYKLHVTARVAWIKQEPRDYQMGLEFVELTAGQTQLIREFLPIAAAVQVVDTDPASGQMTNWG